MKGFIKYDEYLLIEAITEDYREHSEIYNIGWSEKDAIEDLLKREDVKNQTIVQINAKRCKTYYSKLRKD